MHKNQSIFQFLTLIFGLPFITGLIFTGILRTRTLIEGDVFLIKMQVRYEFLTSVWISQLDKQMDGIL